MSSALHSMDYVKTGKFIDNQILFYKIIPLEEVSITKLQVLLYMLKGRSQDVPDKEEFVLLQRKLYDLKARWHYIGYGNCLFLAFQVTYLANRHLNDEKYLEELIWFLDQSLFHPCLDEKDFQEACTLLRNHLRALENNPDHQAMVMAVANVPHDHPLSVDLFGSLEELGQLDLTQVRDLYEQLNRISWQVAAGGILEEEMVDFIEQVHTPQISRSLVEKVPDQAAKYAWKVKDIDQASLVQIYRTDLLPDESLFNALVVANALLGKSQNSLLFEVVREQHSLCYSIASSLVWMDGAMMVRAEILPEGMKQALELIAAQIERIKEGDFDDQDLIRAKDEVVSNLLFKKDSLLSLVELQIRNRLLGLNPDLPKQVAAFQSVNREQVMKAFKHVSLISQAIVSPEEKL